MFFKFMAEKIENGGWWLVGSCLVPDFYEKKSRVKPGMTMCGSVFPCVIKCHPGH